MIWHRTVLWMSFGLIALVGTLSRAQDESATELYGRGVHAYFAGDYPRAVELLSASIELLDSDPRAYYFRGLALAGLEGIEAGAADFAMGADVEVNKTDKRYYDIHSALQRVQGRLRLEIEQHRTAARQAAADRKVKRDRIRYEQLKRREDIVLFDPDRPAAEVDLERPARVVPEQDDPFASGLAITGGRQVDYVPPTPVVPSTERQAPRDPFEAPGAEQPAAEAEDPFGMSGDEDEDPFGGMSPAPKKSPVPVEVEPDDVNPFGADLPIIRPEPPTDSMPGRAAGGANIGGAVIDLLGRTLSGQAADRDPFGDAPQPEAPKQQPAPAPEADDGDPFEAGDADPFGDTDAPSAETPAAKKPADKEPPVDDDPFK
jgi:hypothetical protein